MHMTINNVTGVRADISDILAKIREVSNKSNVFTENKGISATKNFNDVLSVAKGALTQVDQVQTEAEKIKTSYIAGDTNVSLSQVVLSSQKSKLAFEGLVTVRNKILEAYKEIMSMPV